MYCIRLSLRKLTEGPLLLSKLTKALLQPKSTKPFFILTMYCVTSRIENLPKHFLSLAMHCMKSSHSQLTEALLEPGDALHEVVEADPALLVAKSDGNGAEDAAVEAEAQRLQRRSKLVQVEVARPVHVHAFEYVLSKRFCF